jgi:hypothetical protein
LPDKKIGTGICGKSFLIYLFIFKRALIFFDVKNIMNKFWREVTFEQIKSDFALPLIPLSSFFQIFLQIKIATFNFLPRGNQRGDSTGVPPNNFTTNWSK